MANQKRKRATVTSDPQPREGELGNPKLDPDAMPDTLGALIRAAMLSYEDNMDEAISVFTGEFLDLESGDAAQIIGRAVFLFSFWGSTVKNYALDTGVEPQQILQAMALAANTTDWHDVFKEGGS